MQSEFPACISLLSKGRIALKGLNQKRCHIIEFSTTGATSQGEAYRLHMEGQRPEPEQKLPSRRGENADFRAVGQGGEAGFDMIS